MSFSKGSSSETLYFSSRGSGKFVTGRCSRGHCPPGGSDDAARKRDTWKFEKGEVKPNITVKIGLWNNNQHTPAARVLQMLG